MTFLKLQDHCFKQLDELNIPEYEAKYIIAVVNYIDTIMSSNNESISLVGLINNMRRIIKNIQDHAI